MGQERVAVRFRVLDQDTGGAADLGRIVRRNGGRHANRDARGTIGQKVRESPRQDQRLVFRAVIGFLEIDGAVFDIAQQKFGRLGQTRLGISHRGGAIAVDIAEIALALDQRIARGEILRQAHQRVIDRLVAMRVILTDHIADHTGRFLERGFRIQLQLAHGVKQAPVNRFQTVARIGQRPLGDGRKRIGEIALGQRFIEGFFDDMTAIGIEIFAHVFHLFDSYLSV